jgi:Ca2+-binding EF-hand superfamily protein
MFKTISIAILSALIINIVSFNVYNLYVEQEFKGQVVTTNYLNDKITKLKSNVLELRADSIGSISRADLDDTKRFIEYEVSMNKKSIQDFIDSLNKDMERLSIVSVVSQENDELFQEKIEFLLQEIQSIQDQLIDTKTIIDVPVVIPEEDVVIPQEEPEPVVSTTTHIEAYPVEDCSYTLEGGNQNSTKSIQRAVDSIRKKGNYPISILFNINAEGNAEDVVVEADAAPVKLQRTVQRYVNQLKFVPTDTGLSNCKISFNLNVT